MVGKFTHMHSILAVGEVSREPFFGLTKNNKEYARVEIKCQKTTNYQGNERIETEKYVIVTWSRVVMDAIINKLVVGTVIAVTGTHHLKIYEYNNKTTITSEITVPSPEWGGSIHILSNIDEGMCCSKGAKDSTVYTNNDEGIDAIPF